VATTPPLQRGLIDTPILIAYRDGVPDAVTFFAAMQQVGRPDCSQISALALIVWCQDALDLSVVRGFLTLLTVHSVTAHTTRRAQHLLESLPPPCGLTPDDAIIAATAIEHSLPLYTLDPARFANVSGLATLQPY
jgi:predicted nucleic acid-binding protein